MRGELEASRQDLLAGRRQRRRPQRGQDFIVERKIEDGVSLRAQLAMPPHGMERKIRPGPSG
jgi:hypothetical protein